MICYTAKEKKVILIAENEQRLLEDIIAQNKTPRLVLHSCCAPCSSYVLEYLAPHFSIVIDYYNPNLDTAEEYTLRSAEQARLLSQAPFGENISLQVAPYHPQEFLDAVQSLSHLPEGSARCFACYRLRLQHAAALAQEMQADYFCTTLSISPHKNARKLNELGRALSQEYHIAWLPSDFKKKNGYKRSTVLAAEYGLYRQDYCGCIFSKQESILRAKKQHP